MWADDASQPQFSANTSKGFWISGPDDSILMGNSAGGGGQLARSDDAGMTWTVISTFPYAFSDFSRHADGSIVVVVNNKQGKKNQPGWIRSTDAGLSWSDIAPIQIAWDFKTHMWGPIYEMTDGRWAYAPYAETSEHDRTNALLLWSEDQGRTWSPPVAFPEPIDRNRGQTEVALLEYAPGKLIAAIRTDDTDPGGWDGGYFSMSDDGYAWSPPVPISDRIRQPHFYRIGDTFCLTYRQYVPWERTGYGTIRFSDDGQKWSRPYPILRGVQDGPNLVPSHGLLLAFNSRYPANNVRTRQVIEIPDPGEWFLAPITK